MSVPTYGTTEDWRRERPAERAARESQERPWLTEHGDKTASAHEILRTVVGSGVHGIAIEGQDDHDEMGVYVEPPESVFGLREAAGHYVARTVREGERSRPGDTDLVLHCHAPESRVLTADLEWRPIVDLPVGSRLVTFDEGEPTPYRHRHFSTGVITAKQARPMERIRVTTSEGVTVVTPSHPFLIRRRRNTKAEWIQAGSLVPGDPIYSVPTWERDASWEAGYLAGQFDGDGSLHFTRSGDTGGASQLTWAQQAGRPDIPYVSGLLSSLGYKNAAYDAGSNGCHNVRVAGDWWDQARFLGTVRPPRLLRHPELPRLWEARSLRVCGRAVVHSVEPLDPGWMVAIETDTRTYIADGLLSHNSLRKYLALVATGNPTALIPLFAPESDVLHITDAGRMLREVGPGLLSQRAGHRFLGYLRSQRERMVSGRRVPARPELIERYGYDVKYAAHALRLAIQGVEVVRDGCLTLPMPDPYRELVLMVKRGELPREEVLRLIDDRARRLESLLSSGASPLPEDPDLDRAATWSTDVHLRAWGLR